MKKQLFICAFAALAMAVGACSDDKDNGDKPCTGDSCKQDVPSFVMTRSFDSQGGCTLDGDCVEGSFCFQGACVVQCSNELGLSCEKGYYCQSSHGRCVTQEYIEGLSEVQKEIDAAGDTMSAEDKAAKLAAYDLKAKNATNVIYSVMGRDKEGGGTVEKVKFVSTVPYVAVMDGDTKTMSVSTADSVGTVQYAVRVEGMGLPVLKTAKAKQNVDGTWSYGFDIDTKSVKAKRKLRSLLRNNSVESLAPEEAQIITSAGSFSTTLVESPEAGGYYKGDVYPTEILSGAPLPIRMYIKVEPAAPQDFDSIEKITLYLPSSGADIFSPLGSVTATGAEIPEKWSFIEMTRNTDPKQCSNKKKCFSALFSSNNFAMYGSKLIAPDHQVNRAMRIELIDYDASRLRFYGTLKDNMKGLYRTSAIEDGELKRSWNLTNMEATFKVEMANTLCNEESEFCPLKTATAAAFDSEVIRDYNADPVEICDPNQIATLFDAVSTYAKKNYGYSDNCGNPDYTDAERAACNDWIKSAAKCANMNAEKYAALTADEKWFCVEQAVAGILSSENKDRLSVILKKVLEDDAKSNTTPEPVITECGEVNNFKDFMGLCADKGCSLCKDKPELLCGADLLAREYLSGNLKTDKEKTDVMTQWLAMMRESYLVQEYLAWNSDTEIRKSWLKGASYEGSFASSVMDDFNNRLLGQYNKDVLGVQHDVMRKQFTQTTLEMLAQSLLNTSDPNDPAIVEINSSRNAILSELAQTWQSVAEDLGLSARRHDVLSQNDAERLKAASELRKTLFDLYFAGLIESKINLDADQGSLNAGYGSNLVSTISKIESLDQPFEALVFMRDGEIFKDTRLVSTLTDTALGTRQKAAQDSVDNAETRLKDIFDKLDKEAINNASIKDNYLSALEDLRTQIVSLCGYPADCKTKEQREVCPIYTDAYFCGFDIDSQANAVPIALDTELDKTTDAKNINQIVDYTLCNKLNPTEDEKTIMDKNCTQGAKLNLERFGVSTGTGSNNSRAAVAILEYRQAQTEYETALSEYEIHAKKVSNNFETIDAYAKNVESWYTRRKTKLDEIKKNLKTLRENKDLMVDIADAISEEEFKTLDEQYTLQKDAYNSWYDRAAANFALQTIYTSIIHGNNVAGVVMDDAIEETKSKKDLALVTAIANNTATLPDQKAESVAATEAAVALEATKTAFETARTAMNVANEVADYASQMTQMGVDFYVENLDRRTEKQIAEKEKKLQEKLNKLVIDASGNVAFEGEGQSESDLQKAINELERLNEELRINLENVEQYDRDMQQVELLRNEFANTALDLVNLLHKVKVKEVAMRRAEINYLTIAQEAGLLADQFNNKMRRYQEISNIVFSASKFFQHASDLELAETFIEFARNDLSNYLTAVEYLTVRPFVDLRRSIYTARGTNDLVLIKKNIDQLVNSCGSGNESENTVTISMRNRMGITDDVIDGLTPADRFHTMLAAGAMPISAQTRYSDKGNIGDVLKKGEFYSGSFNLSSSFANIAGSCNAKVSEMRIRFVSKEGKTIRPNGDSAPTVTIFYGGQSQLLSCHANIEAITKSIGNRTTFGKYSTFVTDVFGDSINVSMFNVPEGTNYQLESMPDFSAVTNYKALAGYPLMGTYTIVFDPNYGENKGIVWDNVADIEIQIAYTTGTLGQNSNDCKYDI